LHFGWRLGEKEEEEKMKKEEEWRLSAELVNRMFSEVGDNLGISIKCPFCPIGREDDSDTNIPHMTGAIFGAVNAHRSGSGLLIQFECENGHEWQLRFSDHSGQTGLSIERKGSTIAPG
jgi:hypothetical protein